MKALRTSFFETQPFDKDLFFGKDSGCGGRFGNAMAAGSGVSGVSGVSGTSVHQWIIKWLPKLTPLKDTTLFHKNVHPPKTNMSPIKRDDFNRKYF